MRFCVVGFEITVDHPHTHIVKTCNLVRGWTNIFMLH